MLFAAMIYNNVNDSDKPIIFGLRARGIEDAHKKVKAILNHLRQKIMTLDHPRVTVEYTSDGINDTTDIEAWSGYESMFFHGSYKDKAILSVRFTDTVPVIRGGYVTIKDNDAASSLTTLH